MRWGFLSPPKAATESKPAVRAVPLGNRFRVCRSSRRRRMMCRTRVRRMCWRHVNPSSRSSSMNRHERRAAKVFETKTMTYAEFQAWHANAGYLCAWDGCVENFKGEMPKGWTWLVAYRAKHPEPEFMKIPERNV